jgi:hypothetical protein
MKSNAATYMHNVILTNSFWCIFIIPPLWRKSCCSSAANHMSDSLQRKTKRKKRKLLQWILLVEWNDESNKNNTDETSINHALVKYFEKLALNKDGSKSPSFLVSPLNTCDIQELYILSQKAFSAKNSLNQTSPRFALCQLIKDYM